MAVIAPNVAAEYNILFLSRTLYDLIDKSNALIKEKDSFEMLETLHHLTSGFKAYITEIAYIAMDEMR